MVAQLAPPPPPQQAPQTLWTLVPDPDRPGGTRIRLGFHAGQAKVWASTARFVAMLAGTQGGKTSLGPWWLWNEIQVRGVGDYLAVTSSYPLLKLKMLPEMRLVFEDLLGLAHWNAGDKFFEFNTKAAERAGLAGTRIIVRSAENPEGLESATAKAAWLDEVGQDRFRLEAWEATIRRVSLYLGRILMTTTLYNLGWLKQQVYDRWTAHDPDFEVIQFASVENPSFPRAEYERARRTLPDWKFSLFYRGQYDRPPGLIYRDFRDWYREDGGHLVHAFDLPARWPRYVGVDPGGVNTAKIGLAKDPAADVYYLYFEELSGGQTSAEHVADVRGRTRDTNLQTVHLGAKSEKQFRMDWGAAGMKVLEPPVSDVEAGIDRIIALWKTDRLFVFDTCTGIRDELGTYSRVLDDRGEPTDKIKDKERFHRLDALRYAVIGAIKPGPVIMAPIGLHQRSRWR